MKTVHKYAITPGETEIETREGAKFLHVAHQLGTPMVWAEVDMDREPCVRTLVAVPTGGEVPAGCSHVGTVLLEYVGLVFHIYLVVT